LIIEIQSGVPLYDAFINLSKNYETIGKYFKEITDKVNMGTSMEDALNETVDLTPSPEFRRVLWQVVNSLRTGSNIADSLISVIDQITKEQNIKMKEYGRKLNPLVMFYMMIAVILPSLGITMTIVLSTFMNIELGLPVLLFIAFFLGFVQFMFLSIIKFSRPAIEF
jgi:flagellar protein FlaJ